MQVSWKLAALALLLNFSLVTHGQGAETSPSSSPYTKLKSLSSALNGNWHLTGVYSDRPGVSRLPFLSFAIEADETKIHGQGHVFAGCQNSRQGLGANFFTGQIASDGTFEANNYNDLSHLKFSIHGTMPSPGDTTWQGAYTLKSPLDGTGLYRRRIGSLYRNEIHALCRNLLRNIHEQQNRDSVSCHGPSYTRRTRDVF
jgi:hypothetical protein